MSCTTFRLLGRVPLLTALSVAAAALAEESKDGPIEPAAIPKAQNVDYIYEPLPEAVLGQLLPRFVEMQVYHAILESIASEQSARMVAMRNATDNANELIGDLTLIYNKARQESITKELLDITGGAEALA